MTDCFTLVQNIGCFQLNGDKKVVIEAGKLCSSDKAVAPTSSGTATPTNLPTSEPDSAPPSATPSEEHGIHLVQHGLAVIYSLFSLPVVFGLGYYCASKNSPLPEASEQIGDGIVLD